MNIGSVDFVFCFSDRATPRSLPAPDTRVRYPIVRSRPATSSCISSQSSLTMRSLICLTIRSSRRDRDTGSVESDRNFLPKTENLTVTGIGDGFVDLTWQVFDADGARLSCSALCRRRTRWRPDEGANQCLRSMLDGSNTNLGMITSQCSFLSRGTYSGSDQSFLRATTANTLASRSRIPCGQS